MAVSSLTIIIIFWTFKIKDQALEALMYNWTIVWNQSRKTTIYKIKCWQGIWGHVYYTQKYKKIHISVDRSNY